MTGLHEFLTGMSTLAYIVATVFFLRFWLETRDRLFALFALAFSGLALNRALLAFLTPGRESQPYLYLIRLAAFVVIAWAVVDKNRRA